MNRNQKKRFGLLMESIKTALLPAEKLSTLEWFEKHMYMPSTKALGGKVSAWDTPVIAKMLELYDDPKNEVIWVMAAARSGKSFSTLAYIGREITTTRRQILDAWPSDAMIRRQIRGDFNDMVKTSPIFKEIMQSDSDDKKAGNYKQKRYKNGANFIMANMQSSNDMSGVDAPILIVHELDRSPKTTGNDGSVMGQLFARQQASFRKKAIIESTPTVEGSAIHNGYLSGTQHEAHFHFTCCNDYHPIRFEHILPDGTKAGVVWKTSDLGEILPDTAMYCCPGCGTLHNDKELKAIVYQRGEHELKLVPTFPERSVVSVHAGWYLLTPFGNMVSLVHDYNAALKSGPADMASFVNLKLGQPYTMPGSKLEVSELMNRVVTAKPLVVPYGCVMATAGVDVQRYYIAVQIIAWEDNEKRHILYYDHIAGDTSTDEPWTKLFILLNKELETEYSGSGYNVTLPIEAVCVDTGGTDTQFYYTKLRGKRPKYIAIKGSNKFDAPLFKKPRLQDVSYGDGKTIEKGIELTEVGVSQAKVYLYNQLGTAKNSGDNGYTTFGSFLGPSYFKELASEKLVVSTSSKGDKNIYSFEKIQDRNEALDTYVYAFVAYVMTAGHSREYLDYDARFEVLKSRSNLNGTKKEDSRYGNVPLSPADTLKAERIPCKILKNKVWIASEGKFMSAGDVVDLLLKDYIAYAKQSMVAPIGSPDKLLKIDALVAESERAARELAGEQTIVKNNGNKSGSFLV
jgi:phage terminase large subunit GpA-like protein